MIVFATAVTKPAVYERCAAAGFRLAAESDSRVIADPAADSIFRSYNDILEQAATYPELEALVLVHQDVEIIDPGISAKIRLALEDPDVGLLGCVGAVGVRSLAWWGGSQTWSSYIHRYSELGGGDLTYLWEEGAPPFATRGEVDTVDGFIMVLSPWTVHNLRFDESLGVRLHGYDFDFCLQVRAAGRKVVTQELRVVHHHSLQVTDELEAYARAHAALAEKWDGQMLGVGTAPGDWKSRARRAEAEASAMRALSRQWQLHRDLSAARHQQELQEIEESLSLRVTAPLRRMSAAAKRWRG